MSRPTHVGLDLRLCDLNLNFGDKMVNAKLYDRIYVKAVIYFYVIYFGTNIFEVECHVSCILCFGTTVL